MKKSTMFLRVMVLIIILLIVALLFQNCSTKKQNEGEYELIGLADVITSDEELLLKQDEQRKERFTNFKSSISNETEIIVLTVTDCMTVAHDSYTEDNVFLEWLLESEITVTLYYTAIFSVPTEAIQIDFVDGKTTVIYDLEKLQLKSVQIDNIVTNTSKGIIGKEYSPSEVSALTMIATDYIKESVSSDVMLNFMAEQNLVNFIELQSIKALIFDVSIYEKKMME